MSSGLKSEFTRWCREELFTREIIEAAALLQEALDAHLFELYRRLDLAGRLETPRTAAALAADLGFVENADITMEAMLDRLATRYAFVTREREAGQVRYGHRGEMPELPRDLGALRKAMEALGPDYMASLEFLQFGAEVFEEALGDDPELLDKILSGRESNYQELWFRATNTDPLQDVHGIMGAKAIDLVFPQGRILEIGGGTGNGIRNLFQRLNEKDELHRVHHYHFTDISPKFIMATRHEIRGDFPDVSTDWRFADLNRPLTEQNLEPDSFDLIYAVNAAHVAKDLVGFLQSCREVLAPGGRVLFAERARLTSRDMAPRELALNLSQYHRTAAIRNDDYRPVHCYLSPDNWLRAFELAGLTSGEVWPDIEELSGEFPDQYATVVTAVSE